MNKKRLFHFSPRLSFKATLFYKHSAAYAERRAETQVGLHVKCPLLLSDLTKMMCPQIPLKFPDIKFS
jgi:hypothetical protein